MISLCYLTLRPGGFDLLADSFNSDCKDYELVVVDDYPGREERGIAKKYLQDKGINVGWYGKSKHKSYPETVCGFANAVNTAVIHSKGDYVILLCDFSTLPVTWINQWNEKRKNLESNYGRKFLLTGGGYMYGTPKPIAYNDVETWPEQKDVWENRWSLCKWAWKPYPLETAYFGAPIEFFLSINGLDERTDHCMAWNISSVAHQAKVLNYQLIADHDLMANMIDHRVWDHDSERVSNGNLGLWRMPGEVQSNPVQPEWEYPSPNPYNLNMIRCNIIKARTS